MKPILITFFLLLAALTIAPNVSATLPANFQATPIITTGLNAPSGFEFAPDGRIFILERTGEIRVYKNGQLLAQPFAVLPSSNTGDRGLIGIAFDPDFFNNHWVYFYYNSSADLLNYLVRFDASGDVGTNGPLIVYHTNDPSEMLHQGGGLRFGPDGKLYIGIGDNGYHPNAQDLSNPFGKIIRINKDGTIPSDNPYFNQSGAAREIWAYGFRNPWRMQFDSTSGRLYASDVGEANWEEVNLIVKGKNYGWPLTEGNCTSNCTGLTNPTYTYPHTGTGSFAVTAGPVYRGSMFPSPYAGSFFFGDYGAGFIKYMTLDSNGNSTGVNNFETDAGAVVDLKVASDGSLYYLDIYPASLNKVIYTTGNRLPTAVATATPTQGTAPLNVAFSSSGTNDPDGDTLSYSWSFGDNTTSTSANPSKTYNNNGKYVVQLRVSDGTYTVLANPIVIQVGTPPTVTITSPQNGSKYNAGDTINYAATGTNSSGAALPDSAFTTQVFFHHLTHIHPFLGPLSSNRSGSFTIPATGESSPDTYFEINVTATDSNGLSTTQVANIYPNKVNLNLSTSPANLSILLDGIPTSTPQTIVSVVGYQREVRPQENQQLNGAYYHFDHWSDGGAAVHTITIPSSSMNLTAYYTAATPFTGQYFNNTNLSGSPAFTRQDPIINFNWGNSPPSPSFSLNNYSVRWTATQYFAGGQYIFTTTSDDGNRLYIDGNLVINDWQDQPTTTTTYTTILPSGNHTIVMEYYQAYGGAVAQLTWDLTPIQPTPSVTPTPTPGPTTPTPTPPPSGTQLLTTPWHIVGNNGPAEATQSINPNVLQGNDTLVLTFNLHGNCILSGDASAIIFDQPGGVWHYTSLNNYGYNCLDGAQTVTIPLSNFSGLNTSQPVGSFHSRFWNVGPYTIDITSAVVVSSSAPSPTPTPTPTGTTPTPTPANSVELLTAPWNFNGNNQAIDRYQTISPTVLQGKDTLTLTYNLNGFCALSGDASAIIFDQPGGVWHYIPLADYGQNCLNGSQTVSIPLSQFPGLNLTQPVGTFHARFWSNGSYNISITSAKVSASQTPTPTPTPPPGGTQLLTAPWHIVGNNNAIDVYQSIPSSALQGKSSITLTYNLHGLCALSGDASAIIFDQPGGVWHYISLSGYGQNCLNGEQTVTIPLSSFTGLNPSQPVGTFHARFWYNGPFTVDITSAILN